MDKIKIAEGKELWMPAVWSFYEKCVYPHDSAEERKECVECRAFNALIGALLNGDEVSDALGEFHSLAADAINDTLNQAAHDTVCLCGGKYGACEDGVVEIICETYKGRRCFADTLCVCPALCCADAECACDYHKCACNHDDGCYDGPSLAEPIEPCDCPTCRDAGEGAEIHRCFGEGDEGACAAWLMMERAKQFFVGAIRANRPFPPSGLFGLLPVSRRIAGVFLSETIKGVPPNIALETIRRSHDGGDDEAARAALRLIDAIAARLDSSPTAWLMRGGECDGECECGAADGQACGALDGVERVSDKPASSAPARAVGGLRIINGALVAPREWAGALMVFGGAVAGVFAPANGGCGFAMADAGCVISSAACGGEECHQCFTLQSLKRIAREHEGSVRYAERMVFADRGIAAILREARYRLSIISGIDPDADIDELVFAALGVDECGAAGIVSVAYTTAIRLLCELLGALESAYAPLAASDAACAAADMWRGALAAIEGDDSESAAALRRAYRDALAMAEAAMSAIADGAALYAA